MVDYFTKANRVLSYWEDELSCEIYKWKLDYLVSNDDSKFINRMYELYETSIIPNFAKYIRGKDEKKILIMGAGKQGKEDLRALKHAGYKISCFIDNDTLKQGTIIEGIPVISVGELIVNHLDDVVILSNIKYATQFYKQLIELGVSQENIFYSVDGYIRSLFGDIYFDCPGLIYQEGEKDVFIDAGSCDGETSIKFIDWCKGNYEKIYAFEPTKDGYYITKNKLINYKNIDIYDCCLWSEDTKLSFATGINIMSSKIVDSGGDYVKARSIDSVLNGDKVTFIKMDIEGAELEALKGAENSIKAYKPKLAISMYHNRDDLFTIPMYIKEIVPEYKLYLRHHSNRIFDFVLYAV